MLRLIVIKFIQFKLFKSPICSGWKSNYAIVCLPWHLVIILTVPFCCLSLSNILYSITGGAVVEIPDELHHSRRLVRSIVENANRLNLMLPDSERLESLSVPGNAATFSANGFLEMCSDNFRN